MFFLLEAFAAWGIFQNVVQSCFFGFFFVLTHEVKGEHPPARLSWPQQKRTRIAKRFLLGLPVERV